MSGQKSDHLRKNPTAGAEVPQNVADPVLERVHHIPLVEAAAVVSIVRNSALILEGQDTDFVDQVLDILLLGRM